MNAIFDICPMCLVELPDGYPFDHVAIDRALAGDRDLFASMDADARREVVVTGLARGASLLDLVETLSWAYNTLQALLPDEHPESVASATARNERLIRELWEQALPDVTISARTGLNPSKIGRIRKRLGLATLAPARAKGSAHWKRVPA